MCSATQSLPSSQKKYENKIYIKIPPPPKKKTPLTPTPPPPPKKKKKREITGKSKQNKNKRTTPSSSNNNRQTKSLSTTPEASQLRTLHAATRHSGKYLHLTVSALPGAGPDVSLTQPYVFTSQTTHNNLHVTQAQYNNTCKDRHKCVLTSTGRGTISPWLSQHSTRIQYVGNTQSPVGQQQSPVGEQSDYFDTAHRYRR